MPCALHAVQFGHQPEEDAMYYMDDATQKRELARCLEIDRMGAAYLAAHPESPRYCYDCQCWLTNASETTGHEGHAIH